MRYVELRRHTDVPPTMVETEREVGAVDNGVYEQPDLSNESQVV